MLPTITIKHEVYLGKLLGNALPKHIKAFFTE